MLDRSFLAPHALARWAAETPDGIAVEHTDGDSLSFSTLLRESLEFATALQRIGVERGTHVGTMLPNVFDAHRTLLAIGWLRGIEVPLNTAYVGSLLEYSVNLADITILVATAEYADRIREIAPRLTTLQTVVIIDGAPLAPLPFRTIERADFLAGAEPAEGSAGPEYSDVTALLFTSGTTGPSKAVITPWAVVHQFWSFPPEDIIEPGRGPLLPAPPLPQLGPGRLQLHAGARGPTDHAGQVQRHARVGRRPPLRRQGPGPGRAADVAGVLGPANGTTTRTIPSARWSAGP